MKCFVVGLSLTLLVFTTAQSQAADVCKALALTNVPAIESPTSVLHKGDYDLAITEYVINKQTGQHEFCSHGGYCYPTEVSENGTTVEALRLTNCKVRSVVALDDNDETVHELDYETSQFSSTELRRIRLEDKLITMGLGSVDANNTAYITVTQPHSRCAQLTNKAISGDSTAINELTTSPSFCIISH